MDYFKVFTEFVTISLLFCFGFLATGLLALWPGIDPAPPALEGEVLTTGPLGKSLLFPLNASFCLLSLLSHLPSTPYQNDLQLWPYHVTPSFLSLTEKFKQPSIINTTLKNQITCLCCQPHATHSLPGNVWLTAYHRPLSGLFPFLVCWIPTNSTHTSLPATRTRLRHCLIQEALLSSTDELGVPLLLLTPLLVYFITRKRTPGEQRNLVIVVHEMREIMEPTLSRIVTRVKWPSTHKSLEQCIQRQSLWKALIECLASS